MAVSYWIGLTDLETEGQYKWTNGEPAYYTQWADNEPNNNNGIEDCVHLIDNTREGWNDLSCNLYSISSICEGKFIVHYIYNK